MNKKKQAKILLGQIIEMETHRDRDFKAAMISQHKASKAVGDSAILFYLLALKELLDDNDRTG